MHYLMIILFHHTENKNISTGLSKVNYIKQFKEKEGDLFETDLYRKFSMPKEEVLKN